jgi:tetratricopeptide (TPR) repeat protein
MNEAGLTLTVHQHMFTAETRLGGTPIGIVGDIVMRKAHTLADAEAILADHRPIGCWTYLVCDGRRREVLCWEENPDHRTARRTGPADSTFGYANIYLDPVLGATEQDLYPSYWRHNQARHRRANAALTERKAPLDAAAMAGILADTGDPRCRISESIAMLMTVGSVVFRPEDGVFWVATGDAPTSRNSFVPFSLATEDHAPEHGTLPAAPPDEAFEAYRRAYLHAIDGGDVPAARRELERACALRPDEPLYHYLAGLVALRSGDVEPAAAAFDRAIAIGHHHPERVAAFHLWRARAHDLAGRRTQAVADYRAALARPADRAVFAAARRGLRRRFTAARAGKVTVDYTYADVAIP